MVAGSWVRILCYRALGHLFTFNMSVRHDHKLITTGPYSIARHPSYTAAASVIAGTLLLLFGSGSWISSSGLAYSTGGRLFIGFCAAWPTALMLCLFGRVNTEDEVLRARFGKEWDAYAQNTPYQLVPFVY